MIFTCELENWEELNLYLSNMIENSKPFPVILLSGEMGSGKTTFVRQFLQSKEPTIRVNSPSFNLFHEYRLKEKLYFHFDLYRIKESAELINLGFEEIWGRQGIAFVEWWDIAKEYFSDNDISISIEILSESSRKYTVQRGIN